VTLRRLLAASIAGALLVPASAYGSEIDMTPTIRGGGSVTATVSFNGPYRCDSPVRTNAGEHTCPTATFARPRFVSATMIVTAIPLGSGGWVFSHWERCPDPDGVFCTIDAPGRMDDNDPIDTQVNAIPIAVFVDNVPPAVTGLTHTFLAEDNRVSFTWDANADIAATQCAMDGGNFQPCNRGQAFTLSEGGHQLTLRARDPAGNAVDHFRAVRVLNTALVSGPGTTERTRTASFRLRTGAGQRFDCRLDPPGPASPPFADCGQKGPDGTLTIPLDAGDLPQDGEYTFQARARDGGDIDQTPLSRTWTIDSVAPNTMLASPDIPEGGVTTRLTANFTFAATEPATLQCSLDRAAFAACTSPRLLANLAFGDHSFRVRAVDRAGNVDPTPAVRNWAVAAADGDRDGFNQRIDCDDRDPRVHPGAREIPANGKDEDCDGEDAPLPRVTATVSHGWSGLGPRFTVVLLRAKGLVRGSKVELRCLGRGCTFTRLKAKGRPRNGALNLLKTLKGARREFRAGQTLEVRMTARNHIGKVSRYRLRSGKVPRAKDLCLPPGATKPRRRC
jgi:putative metal-binding protein